MANILILNGSPRKNGATASLIKAFTEGAKEAGNEIREAYIQGMVYLPGNFGTKEKAILLSTARGTDYSMTLDQYGICSKYMGWEDLGHILGNGKETEARALGASIQ